MKEYWKPLKHKEIVDCYEISTNARIRTSKFNLKPFTANHHSMNGYDFVQLVIKNDELFNGYPDLRYFPIDDLVAQTFIPIPDELIGKPVKVEHIDGNLRNNHYENLKWVEDIEEWRNIINMPFHQISNWGNVRKNLDGEITVKHLCYDNGYKIFCYKSKHYKVHRLVLTAFLCNFDNNRTFVNHIDEIKDDNYFKNLEWVTPYENNIHGVGNLKHAIKTGKPLICSETKEIYYSTLDAERKTGISSKRIWDCCYGKIEKAGGYSWKWLDEKHHGNWGKENHHTIEKFGKKVRCVETGKIYNSLREACRECNIDRGNFRRVLLNKNLTAKGYHWELVDE